MKNPCCLFSLISSFNEREANDLLSDLGSKSQTTIQNISKHHSVLIENLPANLRNPNRLRDMVNNMYPNSVLSVTLVWDTPKLTSLYIRRRNLLMLLKEKADTMETMENKVGNYYYYSTTTTAT